MKHWKPPQIAALNRLRDRFLAGTAGHADYWRSVEELELYDASFGERIGWKWDAVLRELALREWRPQSRRALDWGCGSGIAGRRAIAAWPQVESLALHDRSPMAVRFARERAGALGRKVTAEDDARDSLLLLSHVISELDEKRLATLLDLATQAREIIWVEAGTHADSRRLCAARDLLLGRGFRAIAPCTHSARCGMLVARNERHWCHHFAPPPAEAFQDARWAEFGRELGIDLRSLPYSFVALTRDALEEPGGFSRVIGEPREARGYLRVLSCQEPGVEEFILQKRDATELFRAFRKGRELPLYRWALRDEKIVGAERLRTEQ